MGSALLIAGATFANSVTVDPTTGETLYVFDTVGAFSWTAPASQNVELLVVGGGGGGGCGNFGGGGGGGQVYHSSAFAVTQGSVYSGSVGAGGTGGANGGSSVGRWQGDNGGDSVFGAITCPGGGGGGGNSGSAIRTGVAGGNSGGASGVNWGYTSPAATGTDDAANGWYGGHKGGDSVKSCYSGGGGGALGEGNIGSKDSDNLWHSGTGGDGYECDITGVTAYYGCGGGGGCTGGDSSPYTVVIAGADAGSANASGGAGAKTHGAAGGAATNGTGSGGGGGGWVSSSPTSGGAGGSGIVAIRFVATTPIVTLTGVERFQDGTESTVAVDVVYPQSGYTVSYSESAEGPWQAAPIAKSLAGVHTVYVKVSAPNLDDSISSATITLKDPSAENDGSFYFVVPAGTAGNEPAAPYQTWATAANDLQTVVDATAAKTTAFSILVQDGTYPLAASLAISNTHSSVRSWTPVTGALVQGGAVFSAGGQYRVGTSKAASLKGLAFTGGTLVDASGAGLYVSVANAVLEDCVFSNNYASASSGNTSTSIRGGGAYATSAVTFKNCLFADNVITAALNTVEACGGGACVNGSTSKFRGCTFLRNVASSNKGGGYGPKGGGIAAYCKIDVEGCQFLTNIVKHTSGSGPYGSALYAGSNPAANSRVANCSIVGNSGPGYGVIQIYNTGSVITNCIFRNNYWGYGTPGAMAQLVVGCDFESNTGSSLSYNANKDTYRNCRFYKNGTLVWNHTSSGVNSYYDNCTFVQNGAIQSYQNTATSCRNTYYKNCVFADNTQDFSFSTAEKGSPNHMISAVNSCFTKAATLDDLAVRDGTFAATNPRFVDAGKGDLHLRPSSPLRERGTTLSWMTGAGDCDGRVRILDRRGRTAQENPAALPDIGCYECADMAGAVLYLK